jgi:hypothetical protein
MYLKIEIMKAEEFLNEKWNKYLNNISDRGFTLKEEKLYQLLEEFAAQQPAQVVTDSEDYNKGGWYNDKFKLWKHMESEHDLTLLDSEVDDIIELCKPILSQPIQVSKEIDDDINFVLDNKHEIEIPEEIKNFSPTPIKEVTTEPKQDGWISVKDRLPTNNDLWLCNPILIHTVVNGIESVFEGLYRSHCSEPFEDCTGQAIATYSVKNWQPLPQPPTQ